MNENNEYYEEHDLKHHHDHDHYECFHHKHPWLSHLLTALLSLLGAFLAFYVVTDWHYKRMLDPVHQMKRMEKMMNREDRAMQQMMQKDFRTERNIERNLESYINIDETPDAYVITVNLRPFNNNKDNVSISTDDNILTVHATNENAQKNGSRALAVSQSYAFSKKVDFNKITKKCAGDKYIITVPMT